MFRSILAFLCLVFTVGLWGSGLALTLLGYLLFWLTPAPEVGDIFERRLKVRASLPYWTAFVVTVRTVLLAIWQPCVVVAAYELVYEFCRTLMHEAKRPPLYSHLSRSHRVHLRPGCAHPCLRLLHEMANCTRRSSMPWHQNRGA